MRKLWLLQNGIHSVKALTAKIEALLSEKNAGYTECQEKKRRANELLAIKRNIDQVLHGAPRQGKGRDASPLPWRPVLVPVCAVLLCCMGSFCSSFNEKRSRRFWQERGG